jgi:peptidoglycan/LPS O-acetylase OafA/YrhL
MMEGASTIQELGAGAFGALIGWYVYYVNRYRVKEVQLGDLVTVIGALGGAAILSIFPAKSDLFGAYGIGLALGFFGYLLFLVICVARSGGKFKSTWFLDGRRKVLDSDEMITAEGGRPLSDTGLHGRI